MSFSDTSFRFLRGLAKNNNKAWFEAHRTEYETAVRDPMRELVETIDARFQRFAPEMAGDPKRSVFRINRDIRFSNDKSPYKTHAACWFYHQDAGRGVGGEAEHGGAGFYFHFSPKECSLGGGIWMPPRPALLKIREAIARDPKRFVGLLEHRSFRRRFGELDEDAVLKRLPRGFDSGHPAEKWLRYQSFTCGREVSLREVRSPALPRALVKDFARMLPFVRWLNAALGFGPASSRLPRFLDGIPASSPQRLRKTGRSGLRLMVDPAS